MKIAPDRASGTDLDLQSENHHLLSEMSGAVSVVYCVNVLECVKPIFLKISYKTERFENTINFKLESNTFIKKP